MDAEDDAWVAAVNGDQDRLPPGRFELMIWRLETTNAAAIDRTFAAAGATCCTQAQSEQLFVL